MIAYKLLHESEWHQFRASGTFEGSAVDLADGFIHLSYADQLAETARRYFAGMDGLVLFAVDTTKLGPVLKDEASRGGALFPHLYGPLLLAHVIEQHAIPLDEDGMPVLPPLAGV